MKKMNRFTAISMAAMMAVASLSACGSSSTPTATTAAAAETTAAAETDATTAEASDGKTYKIGVLQLVQHAALDKANEGFVKALDDSGISYEID